MNERKQNRHSAEAEERFRRIFEFSKDAIAYVTADGKLVDVNAAYTVLLGRSREELLATRYQDHIPAEYVARIRTIAQRILETGEPATFETEFLRKDCRAG